MEMDQSLQETTLLLTASYNGLVDMVDVLLDIGVDPEQADENNMTPLFVASQNGHDKVVKRLLDHGVNVDCPELISVSTPLFAASHNGHDDVVKLLLEAGAQKNWVSKTGVTVLYAACHQAHPRVVETLLKAGADKELALDAGCLPLAVAVEKGHTQIVKLLLEAGADRTKVDISDVRIKAEIKALLFQSVIPSVSIRKTYFIGPILGPCHLSRNQENARGRACRRGQ